MPTAANDVVFPSYFSGPVLFSGNAYLTVTENTGNSGNLLPK